MEGMQTPRIDWVCKKCDAHRYQCIDCGCSVIEEDGGGELCQLCFRKQQQVTELESLKRGDYVLMPSSREHAEAMLLIAERFLQSNK